MDKDFYSVRELAGMLRLSASTVYRLCHDHTIQAKQLTAAKKIRIPASEAKRLLAVYS